MQVAKADGLASVGHVEQEDYSDPLEKATAHDVNHAHQHEHEVTKWQAIKENPAAFFWCLYAVWCTVLVSFETQASGIVIGIPEFRKDFGSYYNGDYVLPANWQSAYSGGPLAASVIGGLSSGFIGDYLGRKRTVMLTLVISYIAITMEFVATTNELFFGGKFLNGFGLGILAPLTATYVGEVSPLALRGFLTCFIAVAYPIGSMTAGLILNSTGDYNSRWAYRAVFCSQYGFAAVATVLIWFLPESPWWLCMKGQDARALQSLRSLGNSKKEADLEQLALIKATLEKVEQETEGASYIECFRHSNLRRTIISIAPLSIQSLSGVQWIGSYFTYYVQMIGYSANMSFKLFVVISVASIFGNLCAAALTDRIGRRNLTLWGIILLTVLLMICGGLAVLGTKSSLTAAISLMIVYGFFYNVTIGATAWNLLTEVSTSKLRNKTVAIGYSLQGAINTMWLFALPYLFNPDKLNLGGKCAFIFGGLSFLCIIYVYFYQVETSGRSYAELDDMFMKKVPVRDFNKSYKTNVQITNDSSTNKDMP